MGAAMLRTLLPAAALLGAAALSGCVTSGGSPLAGAASAPVARSSGAGIEAPGIAGERIAALAEDDRRRALAAEFQALEFQPVGDAVEWRGKGGSGSVSALAPFQVGSLNCRQLVHKLTIAGENVTATGSACREPNGTWTPLT